MKVQRIEPEASVAGGAMSTALRFGGNCGMGAARKVVYAGVLSKITMLFNGSLLVLA